MNLNRGLNLGGYLSQCEHSYNHYQEFINQNDIKQIAGWGFDHVRLPIDYNVLETDDGTPIEEGYQLVEKIISWCKESGLNIILDLHKAFGYSFIDAGDTDKNNLFNSDDLQKRYMNLWANIAKRFGNCDIVAFELLNEVVEKENADSWNKLIAKTVDVIRAITKTTPIIYGGIMWNSANTVCLLEKPKHDNIIFTFHFYEPLLFTHQKAYWVPTIDQNKDIFYPDSMEKYKEESAKIGLQGDAVVNSTSQTVEGEFIESLIIEAITAANKAGVGVYCGEFGVIDRAPLPDTLRWFKEVDKIFKKYNVGFSVWTYKDKDFGLVGEHYDSIRDDLINLWNHNK